jgi:hypothetical protein
MLKTTEQLEARLARIEKEIAELKANIPKKDIWAMAETWKDDPYLDEMLKEIYCNRGRPMTEEG